MTVAALAFVLPLIAAAVATGWVRRWLDARAILDHPNARSSHLRPVPRGAGLAVTPVLLAAWAVLAVMGRLPPTAWWVVGGGALLLVLSWRDDRRGLGVAPRLLGHVAAVVAGLAALPSAAPVFQGVLPPWADRAAAALLWVWFVNLTNFMDGIDGITGTEASAVALGLALVATLGGGSDPAALALAGAALGFLFWNWPPARIFLGDSGSVPLGYLLGWLLLSAAARGAWAPALILPAYYLADATLTLLRRAWRRERLWQAHRQHFYQIALRGGAGHGAVVRRIALGDALLAAAAVLGSAHPWPALATAAAVVLLLLAGLARMGSGGAP